MQPSLEPESTAHWEALECLKTIEFNSEFGSEFNSQSDSKSGPETQAIQDDAAPVMVSAISVRG